MRYLPNQNSETILYTSFCLIAINVSQDGWMRQMVLKKPGIDPDARLLAVENVSFDSC